MKLYATEDRSRFFAVPDEVEPPAGATELRRLRGPPARVDLDRMGAYEIPPERLAEHLAPDLHALRDRVGALRDRLASPEGREALERVADGLRTLARLTRPPPQEQP